MTEPYRCLLCGRPGGRRMTDHHLVPVVKGGKDSEKVRLHGICHDKIHATFTEWEIKTAYDTIEKIRQHPAIRDFVRWVRGKDPDFDDPSKEARRRRRRR